MPEVHTVFVQIEAPKPGFEGRVAEGCYTVEDGVLALFINFCCRSSTLTAEGRALAGCTPGAVSTTALLLLRSF